jgi:autotransporter strand-loop-strand O-heptosyltransferase
MGNKIPNGVIHIQNKSLEEVGEILLGSKLFIGVSSGLSWYAWGLNIPTILISGFTDEDLEPKADVIRVINKDVCNGCWGRHQFDKGDWNWCPEHKGTERHFECSKTITSSMVIPNIKKILKNK